MTAGVIRVALAEVEAAANIPVGLLPLRARAGTACAARQFAVGARYYLPIVISGASGQNPSCLGRHQERLTRIILSIIFPCANGPAASGAREGSSRLDLSKKGGSQVLRGPGKRDGRLFRLSKLS